MKFKRIKLPRKRKKEFIKDLGRGQYLAFRILNEIFIEEGESLYPTFQSRYKDSLKVKKRY